MRRFKSLKLLFATASLCGLFNTSCMNSLDDEDLPESGNVPIEFYVKEGKIGTRVTNNIFEKGDKVGLYATVVTENNAAVYIENVGMTYGSNNFFIPEKEVYYPEDPAVELRFVSYYPYRQEKVEAGSTMLPVSVRTDQNTAEGYSQSDFLIADDAKGKASDNQPVILNFRHGLSKIKLALKPGTGEDLLQMAKDNPRIVAAGFRMSGSYNWSDGTFQNLEGIGSIVPAGEWKIDSSNQQLEGKEFIVIPQAVDNTQNIQVEWNGNIYSCPLPTGLKELESGIEYQVNITATQSSGSFTGAVGNIQGWESNDSSEGNTDNSGSYKALNLYTLSFETSNVYRAYSNGKPIAEICKEYLAAPVNSRAIVAYPVNADETTNMGSGVVLQLLDDTEALVGGDLRWESTNNTFGYSGGSMVNGSINEIYFTGNGIALTSEDAVAATVRAFTLRDMREGVCEEYPIVKVGTQYWMRLNLRATSYRDGTPLKLLSNLGEGPGYFKVDQYNLYFYNGEAINENEISPQGWRLPTMADWDKLYTYAGSASLLKEGNWQASNNNATVAPVTGLSMLNVQPSGIWSKNQHISPFMAVGYWCVDEAGKVPEKTVFFMGESDEMLKDSTIATGQDYYKGLIIRCIKQ